MKNTLQGINSRLNEADDQWDGRQCNESHCYQRKTKTMKRNEDSSQKPLGQHQTC